MPQIKEYQQQVELQGPVRTSGASSEAFGGGVANAQQQFGEAVQNVGHVVNKLQTQQSISDANVKLSELHSKALQQFQQDLDSGKTLADPDYVDTFQKKYDEQAGKIEEGMLTPQSKNFFQVHNQELKTNLTQTVIHGQAQILGEKAVRDAQHGEAMDTSTLINDPKSFNPLLNKRLQFLADQNALGNLPTKVYIKAVSDSRTNYAIAAARGEIRSDPQATINAINHGTYDSYIDGEQKIQLLHEAEREIVARQIDARRNEANQKHLLKASQEKVVSDFYDKYLNGTLSAKEVNNSILTVPQKQHFTHMIDQQQSKPNAGIINELFDRIHLPDGNPKKITNESDLLPYYSAVGKTGLNFLRKEIQGGSGDEGKQIAILKAQLKKTAVDTLTKPSLTNPLGDPEGDKQVAKFLSWSMDEYQKRRSAGIPSKDLLTPGNPQYLGNEIKNYIRSNQDIMQSITRGKQVNPAPNPAPSPNPISQPKINPGESGADYLKRIKGH